MRTAAVASSVLLALAAVLTSCALLLDVEAVDYGRIGADGGSDAAPPSRDGDVDRDPCDRDGDGVRSVGACGGTDCNDDDPRAYPDAGFVYDEPLPGKTGDWDCDGVVAEELPTNVTACRPEDCASDAGGGFVKTPRCGEFGDFNACFQVEGCLPLGTIVERRQGCR